MSKEFKFFIYLLERYAEAKNRSAAEIIHEWEHLKLAERIYDMYELYHIEALENAFADIDQMIMESMLIV